MPGELSLTILTEPSQTLQFTKKLSKYEVWWATDWLDDDFPGGVSFRRPRGAELSEASLTQQIQGCGPITGSVSMIPNAEKFFKASGNMNISAEILGLPITEWVCDDETGECTEIELRSLGEELAIATANLERDDENISAEEAGYVDIWGNSTIRVGVPTGTESHIIRSLRESELFDWVNLTPEACGGSHRSLFAIKKSLVQVGGEFAANGFKDRMVSGLSGFFSQKMGGDQYEGRVQSIDISRVNIPPFPIHVKMDLTVASEITRGVGGTGTSSRFILNLRTPLKTIILSSQLSLGLADFDLLSALRGIPAHLQMKVGIRYCIRKKLNPYQPFLCPILCQNSWMDGATTMRKVMNRKAMWRKNAFLLGGSDVPV